MDPRDSRNPLEVAGYIRVSRIGGRAGEGYISPNQQRESIEAYAKSLGAMVPEDAWYDDQDFSGGNLDRPAWEALVQRIESGDLAGVLVMRTDRFARNVPDGATQIRRIVDELGAIFGSAQEQIDPRTPTGRYMLQLFLNNAELQLNTFKSGWRSAKERAIARGAHIGPTPFGYRRIPKGQDRSGCLEIDADWAPAVRALFQRAAATDHGHKLLANWANENAARPDGKRWVSTSVGHVLANRVHRGEVAYRPRKDDFAPLVNRDAHEPMVDEETWRRAQREPSFKRTQADRSYLLAGLVRCAGCRYRMSPSRGGSGISVYRCIGDHGAGKCPTPSVVVCERIEEFAVRQVQEQWHPRLSIAVSDLASGADDTALQTLEAAEAELTAFARDLTARRLLGDEYHGAMELRRDAVDGARAEHDALLAANPSPPIEPITWESLDPLEVREILSGAIDAVYVRRGRLPIDQRCWIVWAGELDDDVPRKGRKAAAGIRPFAWPDASNPAGP